MIAVLAAAIAAVIVIKNKSVNSNKVKEYGNIEQAVQAADFDMDYTDRLAGAPATGYSSNSSTIEVTYGGTDRGLKLHRGQSRPRRCGRSRDRRGHHRTRPQSGGEEKENSGGITITNAASGFDRELYFSAYFRLKSG